MIIIFGSLNMDMLLPVQRFPAIGETVLGGNYETTHGGKGGNQALAAARFGSKTALVGCVGDDGPGMRMVTALRRDGVMTTGIGKSPRPTGMAVVITNAKGENQIVVSPGANEDAMADQVPDEILLPTTVLLLQGETKAEQNWILLARAKKLGATTILNLAPAIDIPPSALANIDYLIINEIEARQIALRLKLNLDDKAALLAHTLAKQGKLTCIITLGGEGSIAVTHDGVCTRVPALKVDNIVDTTGAGDAYCGTIAAALHEKKKLAEAMKLASVAGSLACTKKGTQDSYAYLGEIDEKLEFLGDITTERLA